MRFMVILFTSSRTNRGGIESHVAPLVLLTFTTVTLNQIYLCFHLLRIRSLLKIFEQCLRTHRVHQQCHQRTTAISRWVGHFQCDLGPRWTAGLLFWLQSKWTVLSLYPSGPTRGSIRHWTWTLDNCFISFCWAWSWNGFITSLRYILIASHVRWRWAMKWSNKHAITSSLNQIISFHIWKWQIQSRPLLPL